MIVFIAYQMMFAIITPALITGAFANRVTFKAYLLFLTVWLLFVYFPFVHMVWGGGLLAAVGRARLRRRHRRAQHRRAARRSPRCSTSGRRQVRRRGPHSIPLVALGTGLLWFGWYGFNAGSEFRVDSHHRASRSSTPTSPPRSRRSPGSSSTGGSRRSRSSSGC